MLKGNATVRREGNGRVVGGVGADEASCGRQTHALVPGAGGEADGCLGSLEVATGR